MNKRKIYNDPVYGFVSIPYDILFDLETDASQRLQYQVSNLTSPPDAVLWVHA